MRRSVPIYEERVKNEKNIKILDEYKIRLDERLKDLGEEDQKYVELEINERIFRVLVHDIIYCEMRGRRQYIHLTDGTRFYIYRSRTALEELFRPYSQIVKLGNWYTLNLDHVALMERESVEMDSGFRLNLPITTAAKLHMNYINYLQDIIKALRSDAQQKDDGNE